MTDVIELNRAATDRAINDLIAGRFSPYVWLDRDVSDEDLAAVFEAARWAPSTYNAQPAHYVVARKRDDAEFERILGCLVEGNQAWAQHVPVLALGIAATTFSHNGKPYAHARHDLGLASANLTLEAGSRGLCVHQMAGIVPDVARETYGIPGDFEAVTALAIGYADPASDNERDRAPRERRPLAESVFTGSWGSAAPFL